MGCSQKSADHDLWVVVYSCCTHRHKSPYRILGVWSGVAKVSCILRHRCVQLILAYSWARPAILVAGKGKGGMFFVFISSVSSLSFMFLFLPCPPLSSPLLSSISLLPFSGR